jgi:hypothetical protein
MLYYRHRFDVYNYPRPKPDTGLPLRLTLTKGGGIIYWLAATHDTRYTILECATHHPVNSSWYRVGMRSKSASCVSSSCRRTCASRLDFHHARSRPGRASDLSHTAGEVRDLGVGWGNVLRGLRDGRICLLLGACACSSKVMLILVSYYTLST